MALADEFFTTWDMRTHVLMTYYAVRARARKSNHVLPFYTRSCARQTSDLLDSGKQFLNFKIFSHPQ